MNTIIQGIANVSKYLLLGISYCCIRNKKKWVFGCHTGFMDNPKYLMLERNSQYPNDCIWISSSKDDIKKVKHIGLKAYFNRSLFGIYHCLTAGVYVYSHDLYDINKWLSGGAQKVCLWHGVGIKKIGQTNSSVFFYGKNPDIFLSTSPFMTQHFKHYLHLPEATQIIEGVYPRCEILSYPLSKLMGHVEKYEDDKMIYFIKYLEKFRKVYFYMPTWRDDKSDFITHAKIDFEKLNFYLEQNNCLFILKLHPNTNIDLDSILKYKNICILEKNMDIYPILPFTNVLITDYSSIYYDYLFLKKEIILFLFDYEEYIKNCRELAYDFDLYTTIGNKVYNFNDLITLMKQDKTNTDNHYDLKNIFWANQNRALTLINSILKL